MSFIVIEIVSLEFVLVLLEFKERQLASEKLRDFLENVLILCKDVH